MGFSFRRLALGVLLLNASSGVLFAILPLFEVEQAGGSVVLATLIVGGPVVAQTLATFVWGALSDRWGRRRELLVLGVLAQSVLFLAYPLLSPVALLLVRILQVSLGATSTLANAVATEDPSRSPGRGLGSLSLWGGVGSLLGILAALPFVGGVRFGPHSFDAWVLFAILGAFSACSVVFLAWAGELARPRAFIRWQEAFRFRTGPWVMRLTLATALVGTANYTTFTIFPLYVEEVVTPMGFFGHAVNATQQLALLSVGAAVGGILISPWTGRVSDRSGVRRGLFLTAPLVYAALWIGFALLRNYTAIFLIWAYPAAVTFQIPLTREVAWLSSEEERGRAVGLITGAYGLGGLGGALVAGIGFSRGLDFVDLFLVAAALDVVGFGVLLAILRGGTGLPRAAQTE